MEHAEASDGLNLTLAVTGASGAVFAREMLLALEQDARVGHVNFVPSEHALRVLAEELHLGGRNGLAEKLLGAPSSKVRQLAPDDTRQMAEDREDHSQLSGYPDRAPPCP